MEARRLLDKEKRTGDSNVVIMCFEYELRKAEEALEKAKKEVERVKEEMRFDGPVELDVEGAKRAQLFMEPSRLEL